ncbi:hypothetical protein BDA96_10G076700 [Sorghum bicolor]|uniref:DUF868 domain-containing protein n=2 Tax=Sorghum bicolor TaxID=4558 RepID=A0A921U021_SORBI|nr:uncharacterized protein LOC8076199 [Sorghum bicolor]EER87970.1 hypothetical protein SORBI_3010G064000 [Sorghum bicolor]KAG0513148.1 hypothetical protein BDA96_10G076700 [Sorghum bicolor]|eukprot:XP_002436603.1 uncharacterized protein LOC8076199 [Sorghum bicolor]
MPFPCFAAGARGGGDPSVAAAPSSSATSVYWTHLGGVTLTWSRAPIGLLLAAELRLAGDGGDDDTAPARFAFRPWLPWRRRGSKRFSAPGGRAVKFSWDLSRARFAATGRRPEPVSRYSLHVSVDGELALAVGDHASSAAGLLLSRRENAAVADDGRGEAYSTTVSVAGERHDVSLAVEGSTMWVAIDGEKALQVRRLRWKFRGSERLDLPSGRRIRVTWDLHGWLFCPDAAAVFVLRFETSDDADDEDDVDEDDDDGGGASPHVQRQSSFSFRNHHQAHGGGGESWYSSDSDRRGWRRGPFRSGSDTSPSVSVASTSAASSAGSVATVSEWAAAEEAAAALKDGGGFSLVVQLWKKRR